MKTMNLFARQDGAEDQKQPEANTMNTAMEIFSYQNQEVRTVIKDGEPWFVTKDVCDVLHIVKYRDAVTRLDRDERMSFPVDTPGGRQEMSVVNESGLYSLIIQSRRPEAKKFRRWVTGTVLPSIRKTGQYAIAEVSNLQIFERAAESERERLALVAQAAIDAPKLTLYERAMASTDALSFEQAAKVLGYKDMGQNKLFDFCRGLGLIRPRPHRTPYQKYINRGYFEVIEQAFDDANGRPRIATKTLIRQQGLAYIYARMTGGPVTVAVHRPGTILDTLN